MSTQTLQAQFNDLLKTAMRARDKQALGVIRMIKAKVTADSTIKGFSGEVDDAFWLKTIASYMKQQKKALAAFVEIGDAGADHRAAIEWELAWLEPFLPKKVDEATTQQWVDEAVAGLGEGAKFGAVMGAVMKSHKAEVDPALVRRLIQAALRG